MRIFYQFIVIQCQWKHIVLACKNSNAGWRKCRTKTSNTLYFFEMAYLSPQASRSDAKTDLRVSCAASWSTCAALSTSPPSAAGPASAGGSSATTANTGTRPSQKMKCWVLERCAQWKISVRQPIRDLKGWNYLTHSRWITDLILI